MRCECGAHVDCKSIVGVEHVCTGAVRVAYTEEDTVSRIVGKFESPGYFPFESVA